MRRLQLRWFTLVPLVVLGLGCAAKVPTGGGAQAPAAKPTGGAVTFGDVYQKVILTNQCTSGYCHGAGAGAGGLTMGDEAQAYTSLVGVKATTLVCGLTLRVDPGSLDTSILWSRVRPAELDGDAGPCAPKMPGAGGLDAAAAQIVKDWISGGAQR